MRRLCLAAAAKRGVAEQCAIAHYTSSPTHNDANTRRKRGKINRVRELLLRRHRFALARYVLRRATRWRDVEEELLHVPRTRRAALSTQAAMETDVFVFHHNAASLQTILNIEILRERFCWCVQAIAKFGFFAILRKRNAIHRTNVDARITLDARRR